MTKRKLDDEGDDHCRAVWAWKDRELSDMILALQEKEENGADSAAACSSGLPRAELEVHRFVLATGSQLFRARLLRWDEAQQQPQQQDPADKLINVSVSLCSSSANSQSMQMFACSKAPKPMYVQHIKPGQLAAAQALVEFMYTGSLPDGDSADSAAAAVAAAVAAQADAGAAGGSSTAAPPVCNHSIEFLVQVLLLADEWDVLTAIPACLQQLQAVPESQLLPADIATLMADILPPRVTSHTRYTGVQTACVAAMTRIFGDVPAVIKDEQQRSTFCQMPFAAVRLWAQQDGLGVVIENDVAVLLSLWWQHQVNQHGVHAVPEQRGKALAACLRLSHITTSFFTAVLPQLPWFKPNQQQFDKYKLWRALQMKADSEYSKAAAEGMPKAWLAASRTGSSTRLRLDIGPTVTLEINAQQLAEVHQAATASSAQVCSPFVYCGGYQWRLKFKINKATGKAWAGVLFVSAVDGVPAPSFVKLSYRFGVGASMAQAHTGEVCMKDEGCGWTELFGTTSPSTVEQWERLMADGKLQLCMLIYKID